MTEAKTNYAELLRRPEWQKRRLEMLSKADWKCKSCGDASNNLHVHHRQYFKGRMPWEYRDDQMIVVCESCHSDQHYFISETKELQSVVGSRAIYCVLTGLFANTTESCGLDKIAAAEFHDPQLTACGLIASLFYILPAKNRYDVIEAISEGISQPSNIERLEIVRRILQVEPC